jgi:NAD(P)-dependent dehydrogenase (short-subunit alcohol dehydrogenase family)
MRLKTVEEQVVVVFGASSGIGRETALRFARRGAKVVVAARTESALSSLVTEIQQFGGEAIYCVSDAADFEQVKGVADLAIQHFGRIDTWAHVAGTAVIGPFEQTTPEEFKRVIEVNLMGQVYGAMVALPHLKREGRGALVHVTSVEARRSLPLQSSYSASKHGVEGFLDALRVELAHEKVPVSITNIMPGVINTPFYTKVRSRLGVQPTASHLSITLGLWLMRFFMPPNILYAT